MTIKIGFIAPIGGDTQRPKCSKECAELLEAQLQPLNKSIACTVFQSTIVALECSEYMYFDLIIVHKDMEDLNGIEFFATLTAVNSPTPVILLVDHNDSTSEECYVEKGFSGVLKDPCSSYSLCKIVAQCVSCPLISAPEQSSLCVFANDTNGNVQSVANASVFKQIPSSVTVGLPSSDAAKTLLLESGNSLRSKQLIKVETSPKLGTNFMRKESSNVNTFYNDCNTCTNSLVTQETIVHSLVAVPSPSCSVETQFTPATSSTTTESILSPFVPLVKELINSTPCTVNCAESDLNASKDKYHAVDLNGSVVYEALDDSETDLTKHQMQATPITAFLQSESIGFCQQIEHIHCDDGDMEVTDDGNSTPIIHTTSFINTPNDFYTIMHKNELV